MAENQKLSTMKEAMFREFFSDFDQLAERLEAIQKSMPSVASEIDIKLQPLRDDITALIGKLSEDSTALVSDSKNIISQTANHHRAELSELAAQLLEKQSVTVGKAVTAATSAAACGSRPWRASTTGCFRPCACAAAACACGCATR